MLTNKKNLGRLFLQCRPACDKILINKNKDRNDYIMYEQLVKLFNTVPAHRNTVLDLIYDYFRMNDRVHIILP